MSKRNSQKRRMRLRARKRRETQEMTVDDIRRDFNRELEQLASDPFVPSEVRRAVLDANQDFID